MAPHGPGEELRLISEALADDEQRGIIVAGAAGVGKTRLARDAVIVANGSWVVRRIAGTASGQQVSLGAFARWAGDEETSPAALVRTVITALTADGKPLLLVDDAHLLDDLSAMVVHQLVLQDAARVVATVRTGQPAPDAITALWKDRLLRRLELQPLSRGETVTLLESALGAPLHTDTAREHEVARLVAKGLTNREIAATMSLSVRTVEGYIYQASSKAGVRARAELADLIRQFGP